MSDPDGGFVMTPLGPFTAENGRWCCGLHCGKPCPYGLKIRPEGKTRPAGAA